MFDLRLADAMLLALVQAPEADERRWGILADFFEEVGDQAAADLIRQCRGRLGWVFHIWPVDVSMDYLERFSGYHWLRVTARTWQLAIGCRTVDFAGLHDLPGRERFSTPPYEEIKE
jgi:hypothetical protein